MALPGMDLQSQYNQTLQNTIGQSQSERLRQTRQQQSLANTDWSQRGVGEDAKRMAGFQEVNPSQMPNMSGDTRSFIQPLLGNYQEGGKQVEGYYGKDNPYTQGGLESILTGQGYARAPSSLGEQFKSVGLKLPNAYGQDYYNASHEGVGNQISAYHTEVAQKQQQYDQQLAQYNQQKALYDQQLDQYNQQKSLYDQQKAAYTQQQQQQQSDPWYKYTSQGFIPGQDNGDWKWQQGAGPSAMNMETAMAQQGRDRARQQYDEENGWKKFVDSDYKTFDEAYPLTPEEQWGVDYHNTVSPEGSGTWFNKNDPMNGIDYRPGQGYSYSAYDSAPTGMRKWMPAITMAALGAMTGGAGAAIGGGAGTLGGAIGSGIGSALPGTVATGLSTGDWGKALGTGAVSALGGGLAGMYGGDLSKLMNMSPSAAQGLIKAGVGLAGNGLMGKEVNWTDALANATSGALAPIMGNFAGEAVGGDLGNVVGGAATKFTGSALNNILKGKDLDIGTAISTLQGAAGGLGGLFSTTNEDKQSVNGPTSLARTLQGVKNGPAATSRRT